MAQAEFASLLREICSPSPAATPGASSSNGRRAGAEVSRGRSTESLQGIAEGIPKSLDTGEVFPLPHESRSNGGGTAGPEYYFMGFSGGAAASAYVAAHDNRVARLVLCACPAEFRRIVTERAADFSIDRFRQIGLVRDRDFPPSPEDWANSFREITPINWIDRIAPRPLLMLQGKDDDLIEEEQAWRLYDKAGEPKDIAIVAGAGHKLRLSDQAMDIALTWLKRA